MITGEAYRQVALDLLLRPVKDLEVWKQILHRLMDELQRVQKLTERRS